MTMRALVYHSSGNVSVDEVPKPRILEPTDVILKVRELSRCLVILKLFQVSLTAICGSDLHLYGGMIPTVEKGDIFGHEV